ncbi:hypothetical protein ACFLZZ_03575 [Nanoarchaeota archaeon]
MLKERFYAFFIIGVLLLSFVSPGVFAQEELSEEQLVEVDKLLNAPIEKEPVETPPEPLLARLADDDLGFAEQLEEEAESQRTARTVEEAGEYPRIEIWKVTFKTDKEYSDKFLDIESLRLSLMSGEVKLPDEKDIVTKAACKFYTPDEGVCIGFPYAIFPFSDECNPLTTYQIYYSKFNEEEANIKTNMLRCEALKKLPDKCAVSFKGCVGEAKTPSELVTEKLEKEKRVLAPTISRGKSVFLIKEKEEIRLEVSWVAEREAILTGDESFDAYTLSLLKALAKTSALTDKERKAIAGAGLISLPFGALKLIAKGGKFVVWEPLKLIGKGVLVPFRVLLGKRIVDDYIIGSFKKAGDATAKRVLPKAVRNLFADTSKEDVLGKIIEGNEKPEEKKEEEKEEGKKRGFAAELGTNVISAPFRVALWTAGAVSAPFIWGAKKLGLIKEKEPTIRAGGVGDGSISDFGEDRGLATSCFAGRYSITKFLELNGTEQGKVIADKFPEIEFDNIKKGCRELLFAKLDEAVGFIEEKKEPGYKSAVASIRKKCEEDSEYGNKVTKWVNLTDSQQSMCYARYKSPFSIPTLMAKLGDFMKNEASSGARWVSSIPAAFKPKPKETSQTPSVVTPPKTTPTDPKKQPIPPESPKPQYQPKTIGQKQIAVGAPGDEKTVTANANTIGDPNKGKDGLGGIGISSGKTTGAGWNSGYGGGSIQGVSGPSGVNVDAEIDEDGNVDVEITPDPNGDFDPDTPIDIVTCDPAFEICDINSFYPWPDVGAPEAPRSPGEVVSIIILLLLLITLGVLSWKYYHPDNQ